MVFVAALAFVLVVYFKGNEKKKIKKQFAKLTEYVSKQPKEGNISMVFKTQSMSSLFADSCEIEIPGTPLTGNYSPEEISSNVARAKMHFSSISLNIYDIEVEIADENHASAVFTASFKASSKNREAEETREISSSLVKVEGKWKFSGFKLVEVLEK